mmetsp:Transcript_15961/g.33791  ORF Transcript_15961/g.33791 Transcript_15961/m.33791 type:complete len:202 (+) Transcript_15961:649-1254(+)
MTVRACVRGPVAIEALGAQLGGTLREGDAGGARRSLHDRFPPLHAGLQDDISVDQILNTDDAGAAERARSTVPMGPSVRGLVVEQALRALAALATRPRLVRNGSVSGSGGLANLPDDLVLCATLPGGDEAQSLPEGGEADLTFPLGLALGENEVDVCGAKAAVQEAGVLHAFGEGAPVHLGTRSEGREDFWKPFGHGLHGG